MTAPAIGAGTITIDPADPTPAAVRGAMLKHTQLFNLTGHPAISLPIESPGLPVGLQLVGPAGDTARLLSIASAIESPLHDAP
jgi:aspartyl-tRNA(Asn)/glutamyl-tRNA(Gln) amidotransferase subunit A